MKERAVITYRMQRLVARTERDAVIGMCVRHGLHLRATALHFRVQRKFQMPRTITADDIAI